MHQHQKPLQKRPGDEWTHLTTAPKNLFCEFCMKKTCTAVGTLPKPPGISARQAQSIHLQKAFHFLSYYATYKEKKSGKQKGGGLVFHDDSPVWRRGVGFVCFTMGSCARTAGTRNGVHGNKVVLTCHDPHIVSPLEASALCVFFKCILLTRHALSVVRGEKIGKTQKSSRKTSSGA